MTLLITRGTIVTATDQYRGDIFIEGEKIAAIGTSLTMTADRTIDAAGKYVFPGGIDVHTHLDMPFGGTTSADDFESGTVALLSTPTSAGSSGSVVGSSEPPSPLPLWAWPPAAPRPTPTVPPRPPAPPGR